VLRMVLMADEISFHSSDGNRTCEIGGGTAINGVTLFSTWPNQLCTGKYKLNRRDQIYLCKLFFVGTLQIILRRNTLTPGSFAITSSKLLHGKSLVTGV
jgi:hypothetical protein